MKFIITEEEKNKIRALYDSAPPDEYEVVGYVNPFRETKYLPYINICYSPEMKDGDLFYCLEDFLYGGSDGKKNNCLFDFHKSLEPNFSDLIGKTVRTDDDKIHKVKKISFMVSNPPVGRSRFKALPLGKLRTPEDILPTHISIVSEEDEFIMNETLKNLIKQKLPIVRAKDLPDCLFELKKIKRVKTDFKP